MTIPRNDGSREFAFFICFTLSVVFMSQFSVDQIASNWYWKPSIQLSLTGNIAHKPMLKLPPFSSCFHASTSSHVFHSSWFMYPDIGMSQASESILLRSSALIICRYQLLRVAFNASYCSTILTWSSFLDVEGGSLEIIEAFTHLLAPVWTETPSDSILTPVVFSPRLLSFWVCFGLPSWLSCSTAVFSICNIHHPRH